jgi:Ca2+-binding EF-hand superfamily protein
MSNIGDGESVTSIRTPVPQQAAKATDFVPDTNKLELKQKAADKRLEIRNYIRNERDTIQRKWLCLQECVNSEERRKEQFNKMQEILRTRDIPDAVIRLIQTLKRCVRKEIRDVGGNPHSIIRAMFIYWDADKTGELNHRDLRQCLSNLGVNVADHDIDSIISYYDAGKGTNRLHYKKLLDDVAFGEPSLFEYVDPEPEIDVKERFEMIHDKNKDRPPIVTEFIDAVQSVISRKMRNEGGTVLSHLRDAFLKFDHDYSNALDADELILAMSVNLKLKMTKQQADVIIAYFADPLSNSSQMQYEYLVKEVTKYQTPMLHHEELTKRTVDRINEKERNNQFIHQKFVVKPSKVVEEFKRKVIASIENKLRSEGGSIKSVVRNAFIKYDPALTGTINNIDHFRSAVRKFGFTVTESEAKTIMRAYDKYGNGSMEYNMITADIVARDPSIVQSAESFLDSKSSASSRTPQNVIRSLKKIKDAIDKFVFKSHGTIVGKDLLYGTCARFDTNKMGKLTNEQLTTVLNELRVPLDTKSKADLINWFDSDASTKLDYNFLVRQLYGNDVTTSTFKFPSIHREFISSRTGYSETFAKSLPPMITSRGTRYLDVPETEAEKNKRKDERRKIMLEEKLRITNKLKELELQKQHIIDQKKLRRVNSSK